MCEHIKDNNNKDRINRLKQYIHSFEKKDEGLKNTLKLCFLTDVIRRTDEAKEEDITLGCACYPNIVENEDSLKKFFLNLLCDEGEEEESEAWYRLKEIIMGLSHEEENRLEQWMKDRKKSLKRKSPTVYVGQMKKEKYEPTYTPSVANDNHRPPSPSEFDHKIEMDERKYEPTYTPSIANDNHRPASPSEFDYK
jgi:hypothetical protein